MPSPPGLILDAAIDAARRSPCAKSKRGCVVFPSDLDGFVGVGWNGMPSDAPCSDDDFCRARCGERCVHAEVRAIRDAFRTLGDSEGMDNFEMLHVKIVDGALVAGGGPSCWRCSAQILDAGIAAMWLFEKQPLHPGSGPSWVRYSALDFHDISLVALEQRFDLDTPVHR